MSYIRTIGNTTVSIMCVSNPEGIYEQYYSEIENKILADGYKPKTSMENLIAKIILYFDCDDNYGEYNPETGCGGWGDEFTLEMCMEYVEGSGGYKMFDYE